MRDVTCNGTGGIGFVVLFFLGVISFAVVAGVVVIVERSSLVHDVDSHKLAKDVFPQNLVEPTNEYTLDFYYEDPEFLKQIQVDRDASVPMMSPDEKSTKMVPPEQVEDAKRQGWTKAVKMVSPEGKPGWVSSEKVEAAKAAGYHVSDIFDDMSDRKVVLDFSTVRPCCPQNWNVETIPNIAVIAFPKEMSSVEINRVSRTLQDRFAVAERRSDIKRWFVVLAFFLAVLLLAFYSTQVAYRLFLYVVISPEGK